MTAIVTTSDINIVSLDGKGSCSTGVLEKILEDGHEVYLVTTRSRLGPTDDWWVKLIDSSKIFIADDDDFQKGWHDLFKALGHEWPIDSWLESPIFWTAAKDILKRKEPYVWGEDVRNSLIESRYRRSKRNAT